MNELLKRLDLIKSSIELNDVDLIKLQIKKLNSSPIDSQVHDIVNKIVNCEYSAAVLDINNYLEQHSGLIIYEDQEAQGLKLELEVLEKKLQELSGIKNEFIHDIEEFNTLYSLRLGVLISKILERKKELLKEQVAKKEEIFKKKKSQYEQYKKGVQFLKAQIQDKERELDGIDDFDENYDALYEELQNLKNELNEKEKKLNTKRKEAKSAKENLEGDPAAKEYKEAENDHKEFFDDYQETINKNRFDLTDEEKTELKNLYREAAKLCHPDIVKSEFKTQANQIIQSLNDAYKENDLAQVKKILLSLKNGKGFDAASCTITDKETLKNRIAIVRAKIGAVELEIETIKADETFKTIQEIDNWDAYFNEMEAALKKQYDSLFQIDSDKGSTDLETNVADFGKQKKYDKYYRESTQAVEDWDVYCNEMGGASTNHSNDDDYWESLF